jgi:hypothetical protein
MTDVYGVFPAVFFLLVFKNGNRPKLHLKNVQQTDSVAECRLVGCDAVWLL